MGALAVLISLLYEGEEARTESEKGGDGGRRERRLLLLGPEPGRAGRLRVPYNVTTDAKPLTRGSRTWRLIPDRLELLRCRLSSYGGAMDEECVELCSVDESFSTPASHQEPIETAPTGPRESIPLDCLLARIIEPEGA